MHSSTNNYIDFVLGLRDLREAANQAAQGTAIVEGAKREVDKNKTNLHNELPSEGVYAGDLSQLLRLLLSAYPEVCQDMLVDHFTGQCDLQSDFVSFNDFVKAVKSCFAMEDFTQLTKQVDQNK